MQIPGKRSAESAPSWPFEATWGSGWPRRVSEGGKQWTTAFFQFRWLRQRSTVFYRFRGRRQAAVYSVFRFRGRQQRSTAFYRFKGQLQAVVYCVLYVQRAAAAVYCVFQVQRAAAAVNWVLLVQRAAAGSDLLRYYMFKGWRLQSTAFYRFKGRLQAVVYCVL